MQKWIYRLDAGLSLSCIKPVGFIKLHQVCENQIRCNLISEMNITGRLPEAGNLELIITRLLPEKTCAAI